MDNFNRTISFVLGLVVVIVFLAVISGRINLKNKLSSLTKSSTTPPPKTTTMPTPANKKIISQISVAPTSFINNYQTNKPINAQQNNLKTIPNTGLPTILLLLLFSSLLMGFGLKKRIG